MAKKTYLKIWPSFLGWATRQHLYGAVLAWHVARHLAKDAPRARSRRAILRVLLRAGVPYSTAARWLAQSFQAGFLRPSKQEAIWVSSQARLARRLCRYRECLAPPVEAPLEDFVARSTRSRAIYVSVLKALNPKPIAEATPIARETIALRSGFLPSRQRELEAGCAGITVQRNMAVTELRPDYLPGIKDGWVPWATLVTHPLQRREKVVGFQLPNTYYVRSPYRKAAAGYRKIRRSLEALPKSGAEWALRRLFGESCPFRALDSVWATGTRLTYFSQPAALRRASKKTASRNRWRAKRGLRFDCPLPLLRLPFSPVFCPKRVGMSRTKRQSDGIPRERKANRTRTRYWLYPMSQRFYGGVLIGDAV